jgi:Asp-tRNA(Asn)/Glu-tRNA(Gln) amidotransferase B subunit
VHKTAITEIKNLNSFSVLERATAYEVRRQIAQWERDRHLGRKSTYGWDEATSRPFHQRDKEDAHDYRYFPDPDLVPVGGERRLAGELKAQVGELPAARRRRTRRRWASPRPTPRPSPATARPATSTSARSPPAARPSGSRTSCCRTAGG